MSYCDRRQSISVVIFIVIGISEATLLEDRKLPCDFLESINITAGTLHPDRSIVHNGITYPYEKYAKINYVLENGSIIKSVAPYVRGCSCSIKPCIRLCCPPGHFLDPQSCRPHDAATNFTLEVLDARNQTIKTRLEDRFAYVYDRPCDKFNDTGRDYKFDMTGHVFHANRSFSHLNYCLLVSYREDTKETRYNVLMCFIKEINIRYQMLPIGMLLSVPFIVATFLVYICLPELRNVHGKCLLCYLTGLASSYISLAIVQLNGSDYVEPLICKSIGYFIYFSLLSTFFWLSVISFDLWWNFRTINGPNIISGNKQFILYMIYAWGLAISLTLIAYILDSIESLPNELRPGIGTTTCFLKRNRVSEFLFFFMPLAIIITINITFFVLTALNIRQMQRDLAQITAQEESSRHQSNLQSNNDNFTLYLRLFILMGVTWSMEAVSWMIAPESKFFYLTDICNTIQGVVIFVLFVLKKRVLRLMRKRWQFSFGKSNENVGLSSNTHSTSLTTRTSNIRLNNI